MAAFAETSTIGVDLIVVSRQFGAGGGEVAAALGRSLGWKVLDREILSAAAERLHAEEASMEPIDEYASGLIERVAATFSLSAPEGVILPTDDVDADALAKAVHDVVRTAADAPPVVVVGHGAQCLLKLRPRTLAVRVFAPFEARVERVARRENSSREAARSEVARRDKQRERYLRHHFGCDPAEPTLYAVQVNTACVSIDGCVECILATAGVRSR
ncbi:MAG TPA: cytidylate kinase-like family protein [Polyangiaceae bacterium]|jgi:cytidylate kinase